MIDLFHFAPPRMMLLVLIFLLLVPMRGMHNRSLFVVDGVAVGTRGVDESLPVKRERARIC